MRAKQGGSSYAFAKAPTYSQRSERIIHAQRLQAIGKHHTFDINTNSNGKPAGS